MCTHISKQPKDSAKPIPMVKEALNKGIVLVDFAKTNLYRNMERGADNYA